MGVSDGRDNRGRFVDGNPGGPGNPHAKQTAEMRSRIREAVTPDDLAAVVRVLIDKAKGGELGAIRELFDRTVGKPTDTAMAERLDELEAKAEQLLDRYQETRA